MDNFSIKDVERITGIKAHTIRIWEKRYDLIIPQRSPTGIRYYTGNDLKKLINIAALQNKGHKISKLASYNESKIHELLKVDAHNDAGHLDKFRALKNAMLSFSYQNISALMQEWLDTYGIEKFSKEILLPFIKEMGILWQADNICPAHEHMVSQVIRQKYFAYINTQTIDADNGLVDVYFLPEDELHELGILYLIGLSASKGNDVVYLGPNLPVECIDEVLAARKVDRINTHLTMTMDEKQQTSFFQKLELLASDYSVEINVYTSKAYEVLEPLKKVSLAHF